MGEPNRFDSGNVIKESAITNSKMVSNLWINDFMKEFQQFIGVYSRDTMEHPTDYPSYTIVNISKACEQGTHYVCIIFSNAYDCLYFDPLNLSFIPEEILIYMFENSQKVVRTYFQIQNELSSFCGFYWLLPILLHMNNISVLDGLDLFKEKSAENDNKCIKLLSILIKIYFRNKVNNSYICS